MGGVEDGKTDENIAGRCDCVMWIFDIFKPKPFKRIQVRLAFEDGMREVSHMIRQDFYATTQTWDHQPRFMIDENFWSNSRLESYIYTDDQIYLWINNGTDPHEIEAVDADTLAFHESYLAKTDPPSAGGSIDAHTGGEFGPMVYTQSVQHPGIEPRAFDVRIRIMRRADARAIIQRAANRAAINSGHRITGVNIRLTS